MDKAQLSIMIVALVAPFIVWGVRELVPRLPSLVLPALATALGPLLDYVIALATGGATQPFVVQLAAGGAAVALREIVDQAKKTIGS
jgi:hypothetical protein